MKKSKTISEELLHQTIKSLGGITAINDIKEMREQKVTLAAIGKKYKIATLMVKAILAIEIN